MEIDGQQLEQGIEQWAEDNSGPGTEVSVECPDPMRGDAGDEFHCIVTDQDDLSIRVAVTIENENGDVTWVAG